MDERNNKPITLPVVTVQHDFLDVIKDVYDGIIPNEKFWVSCYSLNQESVHSKLNAELDDVNRELVNFTTTEGDASILEGANGVYEVTCPSLNIKSTRIFTPVQQYRDLERQSSGSTRITAFDISPDCSRFATGYLDGSLFLYPTTTVSTVASPSRPSQSFDSEKSRVQSRPHMSSVNVIKFFPSSRVILTAGGDFSLTVLDAEFKDQSTRPYQRVDPVQIMRDHRSLITSIGMIAAGRNVVSSSLDSTVKLWDIPSSSVISTFHAASPITCTSLGERTPAPPDGYEVPKKLDIDAREVPETQSNIVFAGLKNGSFQLMDLSTKSATFTSTPNGKAIDSITYSHTRNLLATGTESGVVTLYDTRSLSTPLTSFIRRDADIVDLDFVFSGPTMKEESGLAIATGDGLPYIAGLVPEGPVVDAELIGTDCDPVRHIRVRERSDQNTEIWSAGDDGAVRRYLLR